MCTIKKSKLFFNNYFRVFDKRGMALYLSLGWGIILTVIATVKLFIENGNYKYVLNPYKLSEIGILNHDNIMLIINPIVVICIIGMAFYKDYSNSAYKMFRFFDRGKINNNVVYRLGMYISINIIFTFLYIVIRYWASIGNFEDLFYVIYRFIPSNLYIILLFSSIMVTFNYVPVALSTVFIYLVVDIFSSGRMFKILTIYDSSNVYIASNIFIINKNMLLIVSVLLIYIIIIKGNK